MMQSVVDCVDTCRCGDDHTNPCAVESASGCQVAGLREGAPSWGLQSLARWAPLRCSGELR